MRSSRKRLSAGPVPHWDSGTHPIREEREQGWGTPHCFGDAGRVGEAPKSERKAGPARLTFIATGDLGSAGETGPGLRSYSTESLYTRSAAVRRVAACVATGTVVP